MDGAARKCDGLAGTGPSAAQPTVFGSHVGLFSAVDPGQPRRDIAVLFLSPWGFEEMCTRKFYRVLAERFSAVGVSSLRFDYPGSANAFDETSSGQGLAGWLLAIGEAICELRALSGTQNVVLLGQGLGASLAYLRAPTEIGLAGLMLLGPVLKGRGYLREVALWSKMIDESMKVKAELRQTAPGSIAGLTMPSDIAEDVKRLDLTAAPALDPAMPVFFGQRAGNHGDIALGEILQKKLGMLKTADFTGYEQLVSGPLSQTIPLGFVETLLSWLQSLPQFSATAPDGGRQPVVRPIACGASLETPVRFGPNEHFFGTLCEPVGPSAGVTAVILSTAYDHQAGWGRSSATMARRLAALGMSSLRYDGANIGDSPAIAGRRKQVLYDDAQLVDVSAALDFIQARHVAHKTMIVGRCSGAYIALRSAVTDGRWNAMVTVNLDSFRWRFKGLPRTLVAYSDTVRKPETIKRMLAREVDVVAVLRNVTVRLIDRFARFASRFSNAIMPLTRLSVRVHGDFRKLEAQGTRAVLVYAEGDAGLEEFHIHFGAKAEKLAAYRNAEVHIIAEADHNLTPVPARERLFDIVEATALQLAAIESP